MTDLPPAPAHSSSASGESPAESALRLTPGLVIREATAGDVPAMVGVVNRAYRGEGGWTREAHLVGGLRIDEAEMQSLLDDPDYLVLVAEQGGRLTGCCYTHRHDDGAEFGLVAVDPDVQSAGVGGALLDSQVARRALEGLEAIDLRVLQSRPELAAWYSRHGFVATGEVTPFAGVPGDLKVPGLGMERMVRDLRAPYAR